MKLTRARSVKVLPYLLPHLTFSSEEMLQPFLEELAQWMLNQPDYIHIQVVIEDDELIGFTISQNPSIRSSHVNLLQAWIANGTPLYVGTALFAGVKKWASAFAKSEIKAETSRGELAALYRRYGFDNVGTVLSYEIPEEEGLPSGDDEKFEDFE